MNTGIIYLTDEVRARPNLDIARHTQVDRILFDGKRAAAVLLVGGRRVDADEIVLCAGTYGSPAVLLRSGIGPAGDLTRLGIDVIADLPVGVGLRDHPVYFSTFTLNHEIKDLSPAAGAALEVASQEAEDGDLDLWVFAYNMKLPPIPFGRPTLMLGAAVMRPRSRGRVALRSRDPKVAPVIEVNLLADVADRRRLIEAVRLARRLAATEPLASLIDHETAPGVDVVNDADLLKEFERNPTTFDHGCCTVPMGGDDDPDAVVDGSGRVRGVERLRVVDASIFPDTMSVPINLTTIMVAERISVEMRNSRPVTKPLKGQ